MKNLSIALLLLTLAGCTGVGTRPLATDSEQAWHARREQLAALNDWSLTGRLAIRTDHEGWHATIQWEQNQRNYAIRIIAPLGQGSLSLEGDPFQVVMRTSEGESIQAADPEWLLYRELGWRVPVASLAYWVRGLPAPGQATWELDAAGRLVKLQQAQWNIEFLDYETHNGIDLPGRVFVSNHQAQVRLAVSHWELPQRKVAEIR